MQDSVYDKGESLAQAETYSHTVEPFLQTECKRCRKEVLLLNASAKRSQEQGVAGLPAWPSLGLFRTGPLHSWLLL